MSDSDRHGTTERGRLFRLWIDRDVRRLDDPGVLGGVVAHYDGELLGGGDPGIHAQRVELLLRIGEREDSADLRGVLVRPAGVQVDAGAAHQRVPLHTVRGKVRQRGHAERGQLGGRVAFVSNRDDVVCDDTRENLKAVGFVADMVLCRVNRVSDKSARFATVQQGAQVLVWVGDNIQDFPALTQAVRNQPDGFQLFGDRYFVLPNPMYGSWEANARN